MAPAPRLYPLFLATMASQALLVVLSPTIVAVARELGSPVGAVGQARSITAAVAIVTSAAITRRADVIGVRTLLVAGALVSAVGCAIVAGAPSLATFLAAHALVGVGFACLLSAGFAGVGAFPPERRAWAIGYVAGANALAWIVVNPVVGSLTDAVSWRAAEAAPALLALAALAAAVRMRATARAEAPPPPHALLATGSARRWLVAELIAYGAWTALLTFIGAFFIQRFAIDEALAGWLLAAGAAAYFVASTRSRRLVARVSRRGLVVAAGLAMAVLLPLELAATSSVVAAAAGFCLLGLVAGVRTPASSALGLAQLPAHPGAMMSARTGATQLGYLLGAIVGGALLTGPGYAALGAAMAVGMVASAVLVLGVEDTPAPRAAT